MKAVAAALDVSPPATGNAGGRGDHTGASYVGTKVDSGRLADELPDGRPG
ncbi:MAG: hypothetical protein INH41_14020, partial [Myxococcaceae bacterium]|nr:hypothetical protein [Myxococcaceae bacterium]